jgi:ElaB/YqjD/DUF883 family membrane-anchored ribosome-binding protein
MSSNANSINANTTNETAPKVTDRLGNVTGNINDAVQKGISTLKDQYNTVQQYGVQGVRDDVTNYARKEPLKALLVAGGIGALAALIFSRR